MNPLNNALLAEKLGLRLAATEDSYLLDWNGLSRLIRQSVYRRGIITRRELASDWRDIFETFGASFESIRGGLIQVADALAELGDLTHVSVGKEHGWAKAPPRWISLSTGHAVALGAIHPTFIDRVLGGFLPRSTRDLPRRFDPRSFEAAELITNVEAIEMSEWFGKPGWSSYCERRGAGVADTPSLREFWHILRSKLRESELTSDDDSKLRLVGGNVGDYFGRYSSEFPEGRWKHASTLSDGEYLGARRGFQENDWRFLIAEVIHGSVGRVLQLEDYDEFKWALLARGIANDDEEKLIASDDQIRLTFPAPKQLERLLDLYGWRKKRWEWKLEAPLSADKLHFWRTIRPFA